ncbi:MAG: hypothetical protein LBV69_04370 [Bacteroidales bacterium]|jgi:hypothetical protein|nr:hypothetical protein [Bacteroidales bacterium]
MKKMFLLFLGFIILLSSCNKVPDKTIFKKLDTDELAKAIKSDTLFVYFYENISKKVDNMSDIKKAKYNDITYRRLFKYVKFMEDTTYWKPIYEKWKNEWENEYGIYLSKADSVLNYWKKYLAENSLDKYVDIELDSIETKYYDYKYYEYIDGIDKVNLFFKLTPLQGTIEQICFNYSYKPKIYSDSIYYRKYKCISTSPFSSQIVGYWEVNYFDRDNFGGKNVEMFLRDYDMYIEITNIRKDGVNIGIDNFSVPKEVSGCLEFEKYYPINFEYKKGDLIKKLIYKDYLSRLEYYIKQQEVLSVKKDKLCFDFCNDLLK